MGYSIHTKKINIKLTPAQELQVLSQLDTATNFLNPCHRSIEYIRDYLNFEDSNLNNFLDHMHIYYERTPKFVKLISQHTKYTPADDFFFEQFDGIVNLGSYITWKGEDGVIFGIFYGEPMARFETYKELNELKERFTFKQKLEQELINPNLHLKKTKI